MNNAAKTTHYVQVLLAGLCLVFLLVLVVELNRDYTLSSPEPSVHTQSKNAKQISAETDVPTVKNIDDYDQIIERPLFMSDRRPYVRPDTASTPNSPRKEGARAQSDFMLSAVIITDKKRIALLQSKKDRKLQKLHQGDEIDGWTLTEIRPSEVFLSKGSAEKRLELMVKRSSQQAEPGLSKVNEKLKLEEIKTDAEAVKNSGATAESPLNKENKRNIPSN